jgi:guanyl-specific ribonuclease Sa
MTKEQAIQAWETLNADKASYYSRCAPEIVGGLTPGPYNACIAELNQLNEREAALRTRLGQLGVRIADEPTSPPRQPGADEAPGTPAGEPPAPQNVQDTLEQIDAGKWPGSANAPGTKGGSVFKNTTPGGEPLLPTTDASGKPITYQEWDVNPRVPNLDRGGERIVTGSDGSAWYTTDHYHTFHRIR